MNPIAITEILEKNLKNKIRELLPIEGHCDKLDAEFKCLFDDKGANAYRFTTEPYVESIPFYQQDDSTTLASLEQGGIIEPETAELFARYFGCSKQEATLYAHQNQAIVDVCSKNMNLVVCSGTGSGKTESFLIPLINSIIKERKGSAKKGEGYKSGVRAMLLYPMNALVNDQLLRIRNVLSGAQKTGKREEIPYACDISFGIYTGDVDKLTQEAKNKSSLNNKQREAVKEAQDNHLHEHLDHPYLSESSSIKTEYSKRSQWHKQAADIFITNYSMLELLLLNGEVPALFSPTWRFIVLDEAHSYDGSLGTEIAWLIRRVKLRTASDKLQYLATSATLIEDGDEDTRRVKIQNEFASQIFPAAAESFSVQFGSLHTEQWAENKNPIDRDYKKIVDTEDLDLKSYIEEHVDSAIQPAKFSLLEISKWLEESKIWLKGFDYLSQTSADQSIAFGDAIELARLLGELDGSLRLNFADSCAIASVRSFLKSVSSMDKEAHFKQYIRDLIASELKKDINNYYKQIESWIEGSNDAVAPVVLQIIALELYQQIRSNQDIDEDINPLEWRVEWSDDTQEIIKKSQEQFEAYKKQVESIKAKFNQAWARALNSHKDFPKSLNDYISQGPHLQKLYQSLLEFKDPEEIKLKHVIEHVFGEMSVESENQFHALTQLLTLSQHAKLRNKPLMDLRFHQQVSGISSMAISFDDELALHLYPDDDSLSIVSDGKESQLYTLGCCRDCGFPFLIVYSDIKSYEKAKPNDSSILSRYYSKETPYFHAVSWIQGKDKERKACLWLNYHDAELYKKKPKDNGQYLPIYHYANAGKSNVKEHSENIKKCPIPCCEAESGGASKYGIIAPYESHLSTPRIVSLLSLIEEADADASPHKTNKTKGRKVLCFSDSRNKAASLTREFDIYTEERMVERFLIECLNELADIKCGEAYEMAKMELGEGFFDDEFKNIANLEEMGKNYGISSRLIKDLESKKEEWFEKYKSSILLLVPCIKKKLREANAEYLLTREYEETHTCENGKRETTTQSYTETASAIVSCLSVLRQTSRHSLLRKEIINIHSYEQSKAKKDKDERWSTICSQCNGDEDLAQNIFDDIFFALFKRARLDCRVLDKKDGENYKKHDIDGKYPEAMKSVTWDVGSNDVYPFKAQKALKFKYKSKFKETQDLDNLIGEIYNFIKEKNIILASSSASNLDSKTSEYRLNLDDVRFELNRQYIGNIKEITSNRNALYYRIEEHTAQLSTQRARLYQNLFSNGKINILSSSTTFEMGVDLGNLNCIFLCNMPPKTANYKQRAGRAGRRAGSSSYVLTMIGASSHDKYFKENPHELIFGKLTPPQIYLNNASFRAKHFRAEAFHHFIKNSDIKKWKQCGDFFLAKYSSQGAIKEREGGSCIKKLPQWAEDWESDVQKICLDICAGAPCDGNPENPIPYSVCYDLCFQLIGYDFEGMKSYYNEKIEKFKDKTLSSQLAGVHLYNEDNEDNKPNKPNYWVSDLLARYNLKIGDINRKESDGKTPSSVSHLLQESTVDFIAKSRVFPRYGFPCDIIELKADKSERKNVRMSRDLKLAIFEYAPGQEVVADKRTYPSKAPIFYQCSKDKSEMAAYYTQEVACCKSSEKGQYYLLAPDQEKDKEIKCPICGKMEMPHILRTIKPDDFQAGPSVNNRRRKFAKFIARHQIYNGGKDNSYSIDESNLIISESKTRELLYLNIDCHVANLVDIGKVDGIMHSIRTDMVIWGAHTAIAPWNDDNRTRHAWQSALEAIIRATALVCEVTQRDIGGVLSQIANQPHIVIFDNAASGSGVILRMFATKQEREHRAPQSPVADLCKTILKRALDICTSCTCCLEGDKGEIAPQSRSEHLRMKKAAKPTREYYSCYKCIKDYTNQASHLHLDAHDASVIISKLIEPAHSSSKNEDSSSCMPPCAEAQMPKKKLNIKMLNKGVEISINDLEDLEKLDGFHELDEQKHEGPRRDVKLRIDKQDCNVDYYWAQSKCVLMEEPIDDIRRLFTDSDWQIFSLEDQEFDANEWLQRITLKK